jgi:hypothetical protein
MQPILFAWITLVINAIGAVCPADLGSAANSGEISAPHELCPTPCAPKMARWGHEPSPKLD